MNGGSIRYNDPDGWRNLIEVSDRFSPHVRDLVERTLDEFWSFSQGQELLVQAATFHVGEGKFPIDPGMSNSGWAKGVKITDQDDTRYFAPDGRIQQMPIQRIICHELRHAQDGTNVTRSHEDVAVDFVDNFMAEHYNLPLRREYDNFGYGGTPAWEIAQFRGSVRSYVPAAYYETIKPGIVSVSRDLINQSDHFEVVGAGHKTQMVERALQSLCNTHPDLVQRASDLSAGGKIHFQVGHSMKAGVDEYGRSIIEIQPQNLDERFLQNGLPNALDRVLQALERRHHSSLDMGAEHSGAAVLEELMGGDDAVAAGHRGLLEEAGFDMAQVASLDGASAQMDVSVQAPRV
ncbi:MAG: hypothetical protein ACLFRA_04310 [Alphaproteobacteria bacterium]